MSADPDQTEGSFEYAPGLVLRYGRQGSGPVPVLLIHGFAASRTTWDDLRGRFPRERYTLYLLDLPGSGRSSKPRDGEYSPLSQAGTVIAFLEGLDLSGAVLVGHSYGGTVALLATLTTRRSGREDLVAGTVLIGAPAWPQPLPRFFRYLQAPLLGGVLLRLLPNRLVVERALRSVYHDRRLVDDRHRARYRDCFRGRGTVAALVRTVRQMIPAGWEELCAGYPSLGTPLLLIWGSDDRVVRPRQGERLRDAVPGARLEVIPHCGHNPHEEFPDETWRCLQRFLDGVTHREGDDGAAQPEKRHLTCRNNS